jgi:predicted RNA-binding protein with PIN domain
MPPLETPMSLHIIIDGYNLIRQSNTLSAFERQDIQLGREALLDTLATYKRIKRHRITVVFDGTNAPSFSSAQDRFKGINIVFSRYTELADEVIKRMAKKEKEKALIVTSDRDVIEFAEAQGSATIHSPMFEQKITMASSMDVKGLNAENDDIEGWVPSTKKKGPRRRLSKKDRYNRIKIRKL